MPSGLEPFVLAEKGTLKPSAGQSAGQSLVQAGVFEVQRHDFENAGPLGLVPEDRLSESLVGSKLKNAQRREQRAAQSDKRAAQLEGQMASKQRSLASAETSLARALAQEGKKTEGERRRQREADLSLLRRLESARHTPVPPRTLAATSRPSIKEAGFEYDVCLSFAGEDRGYVELVARGLQEQDVKVFYDSDEAATLWGKDLAEHLDHIYRKASRFCLMFISDAYARKEWTRHERRSALARAVAEEDEYILPARFDDIELEGLRPTVSYIDLREYAPETLVEFVLHKLGRKDVV